jgi:hypothetical protein
MSLATGVELASTSTGKACPTCSSMRREAPSDLSIATYEGVGHRVLWEQPERVAKDVTAFIVASQT